MKKKECKKRHIAWRLYLAAAMCMMCTLPGLAQHRVTGVVSDREGTLPGVNVHVKGTTAGVASDADGKYTIDLPGSNAVLVYSYIGYVQQEIATGDRQVIDVVMEESSQSLDEVVVIGYGTQKKANLSGAVAAISSDALANRPVRNANVALQGLAPGMNIDVRSGRATDAPGINIRGTTSINGGEAFILVDNVPVTATELARINPADIESSTVLQDAAAAAIYGARAAYGVVLITTKTAKSSKLQIDFDANYGVRQLQTMPDMMIDPYEFMSTINAAVYPNVRYTDAQVAYAKRRSEDPSLPETIPHPNDPNQWDYYANNDWASIIYRNTSPTYNVNLRVSQKTGKLTYDLSGSYYQQDGMLNMSNDIFKRYNFRGKGLYQFTDWWSVGSNISFVTSDYGSPTTLDHGYNEKVIVCRTFYPVHNPDGTFTEMGADVYGLISEGGRTNTQMNETQVSFNTTIDLLKDVWSVKGDANFRRANTTTDKTALVTHYRNGPEMGLQTFGADGNRPYNRATTNINNYTVLNLYTDFHKTFGGRHYVQGLAGFNQERLYINDYWVQRRDLITNSLPSFQLATGDVTQEQSINELALRGLFFRANYIFDNKYILEFNGRRDGTSRYPKDGRWGFFPSGSAAWVVSRENFFSGIGETLKISNLKLRGSYGELGNQVNSNYYPYYATMGAGSISTRLDGAYPMGINQPGAIAGDLTWERVRTVNGGLDLGLLDNRLDLTANIYARYTEGMLTGSKALPGQYGTGAPTTNAANLKTKGWDVSLGYRDRVNAGGSPLAYSARFMLWDSRAWITKFDNPTGNLGSYYEGQELGELWGYTTLGYFTSDQEAQNWADQSAITSNHLLEAGDLKFEDRNNDGKINAGSSTLDDPGDRSIIGNSTPRYRYSFEGTAEWKGFDLRIFLHGVGKRDFYITNRYEGSVSISPRQFFSVYDSEWINPTTAMRDRWTAENPDQNAYFPRLRGGLSEIKQVQTRYMQDASWMRIKNLTVGYTLPDALTEKWKISRLRVYLSAENLWTLNKIHVKWMDPEVIADEYYPIQKEFSMGVSLNF
ncbi:MAG: TonB-dependent receptor [Tannerella sp.]|jgi:TonB-linked SusC/RagA family outer membrane protein|nr:TonB-dependent receptor [Tannerella sp.]